MKAGGQHVLLLPEHMNETNESHVHDTQTH